MAKCNVAIVHSSFAMGGAENMVYELAKNLDPNTVDFSVITLHKKQGTLLEEKVEKAGFPNVYAGCQGRVTPKKLLRVYKFLKKHRTQVIHAHMSGVIYSLPWLLTHRCKMIVTAHTTPKEAFNRHTTAILKFLAKAGKVTMVAVSEENQRLMARYYGIPCDRVVCVNNGVDVEKFYRTPHERLAFIHVGRQDKNKNQAAMIRQFARLQEEAPSDLILCGEGPEQENLKQLAEDLGVRDKVEFTGNVANVEDYLARADIYLQTSHREGLPLATAEGMAAGLPVISTDVGGMKNLVRDNGFLVPDHDEDALYQAMKTLALQEELRRAQSLRSREISLEFSSRQMALAYTEIYFNSISKR